MALKALKAAVLMQVCRNFSYPRALEMLKAGKVDLKSLIAFKVPLTKIDEAFKATAKGLTTGFKALISCVDNA